eukprot:XP_001692606.1 predicted protein [Chlamydomonas reinhardtii]
MEWENTKENCVPVRAGRSKAALQELADPAAEALEAKRKELWAQVAEYQGDDPLEAWQKYIKWMQEYGVGGGKADLQKVLETCTKELQRLPRYNNDIRFLRIWIQYADCLPDPGDVFLYLREKDIGRDFALYYEAYATFFELRANFQSADAVYMDGVQRGAKPLERLKQKHTAFQQRMAHRIKRRIQDEQELGPTPVEPVALGRGTRPLAVVADDEFMGLGRGDSENGPLPGYSTMPQMNNLKELKPYTVIRKENTDRATAWNQFSLLPGGSMGPGMGAGGGVAAMHPLLAPASAAAAQELDPLLRSLAPPPALLRGSQPAALAALGLTAAPAATRASGLGGAAAAAAPLPAAGLSGPGKSALAPQAFGTGKLVQQPAAASAGVTAAPAPVSVTAAAPPATAYKAAASAAASAAPTAVPGPPPLHPVAAAALSAGTDVDASHFSYLGLQDGTANEMSYEELRAQAWMRRNPPHKRPASATSGPAAAVAAPASTWSQEAAAPAASLVVAQRGMAGLIIPDDDDDGENGPAVKAQKTAAAGMAVGGSSRRAFGQVLPGSGGASALSGGGGAAGGIGALGVLAGDNDEGAGIAAPTAPAPAQVADENPPTRRTLPGESGAGASVAPVTLPSLAATTRRPALGLLHDAAPAASPAAAYEHPPSAVPPQLYAPQAQLPVEPPAVQAAGPRPEPTVTISTRGAFDLLNSMFSDDLPHQQQRRVAHQPQPQPQAQPQARPAPLQARVPQFATAPVVEPAPALGMAPLQAAVPAVAAMAPAPAVAVAAAAAAPHEPTVTLHTRLAFDAINDMFSDALPHEEARRSRRVSAADGGGATTKPITSSDVRRLANAGRAGAGAGGAVGATAMHAPASALPSVPMCPAAARLTRGPEGQGASTAKPPGKAFSDGYLDRTSGFRVSKPVIGSLVLHERLSDGDVVYLHLKDIRANREYAGRWATMAVLVGKTQATGKDGGSYSRWTLNDLAGKQVTLFLWRKAAAEHYKEVEGSLLLLWSPQPHVLMLVVPGSPSPLHSNDMSTADKEQQGVATPLQLRRCTGTAARPQDGQRCTYPSALRALSSHRSDMAGANLLQRQLLPQRSYGTALLAGLHERQAAGEVPEGGAPDPKRRRSELECIAEAAKSVRAAEARKQQAAAAKARAEKLRALGLANKQQGGGGAAAAPQLQPGMAAAGLPLPRPRAGGGGGGTRGGAAAVGGRPGGGAAGGAGAAAAGPSAMEAAFGALAKALPNEKAGVESRYSELSEEAAGACACVYARDALAAQLDSVMQLKVTAWHCATCERLSEWMDKRCRDEGHALSKTSTLKRFWKCDHCNARITTLGVRFPGNRCSKCNNPSLEFTACSMYRGPRDENLFACLDEHPEMGKRTFR